MSDVDDLEDLEELESLKPLDSLLSDLDHPVVENALATSATEIDQNSMLTLAIPDRVEYFAISEKHIFSITSKISRILTEYIAKDRSLESKLFLISICSIRILNILKVIPKTIISKIAKGATLTPERIITDQTSSLNEYLTDKGFNVTALDQNQVYRLVGNLLFEDITVSRTNRIGACRAGL